MTGVFALLAILASALPLYVFGQVVEPFAGRKTVFQANVALSASVSISLVVNGLQFMKGQQRKSELKRLRRRITELEDRINELQVLPS